MGSADDGASVDALAAAVREFYRAEGAAAPPRAESPKGRGPYEHPDWPGAAVARYRGAFLAAVAQERPAVRAGFVTACADAWRAALADAAAHVTGTPAHRLAVGVPVALADERLREAGARWQAEWRLREARGVAPWVVETAARLWLLGLPSPAAGVAPYIEDLPDELRAMDRYPGSEVAWSPHEARAHARKRLLARRLPAAWVDGFLAGGRAEFERRGMRPSGEVRRTGIAAEQGALRMLARRILGESYEEIAQATPRYRKRPDEQGWHMEYPVTKQAVHEAARHAAAIIGLANRPAPPQ